MTDHNGDEIASERLAALLNDVDPPGPGMEVGGLIVAGRRSARRHRTLLAGSTATGVAVLLVAGVVILGGPKAAGGQPGPAARGSTSPSTAPPSSPATGATNDASCRVQTLSAPVPVEQVLDIDPSGRYVVASATGGRLVVWTDGVAAVFKVPGDADVNGAVVNRNGVVAFDVRQFDPPVGQAWIKIGTQFTRLTAANGWDSGTPRGIDSAGDVVTWTFNAGGDKQAGVFYAAGHPGAPHVLAAPSPGGAAYGIGDTGTIAGNVGDGQYAFYWDSHHHGHKPPIPSGYGRSKGNATAGDWMVGYVADQHGQTIATRWNLATGKVDTFAGRSQALDVDRAGDFTGGGAPLFGSPYLFRAGDFIDLPVPSSAANTAALALTDDGRTVLGTADLDAPGATAILWHC